MTIEELKDGFLRRGYEVVPRMGGTGYVLVPVSNPHRMWDGFNDIESLERHYLGLCGTEQ